MGQEAERGGMKWNTKLYAPKIGATRKRRVFAWTPTVMEDRDHITIIVWLETYEIVEEYNNWRTPTKVGTLHRNRWKIVARNPLYLAMG